MVLKNSNQHIINLPRIVSTFKYEIYTSQRCINLLPFRPLPVVVAACRASYQIRKIENLNSLMSEVASQVV